MKKIVITGVECSGKSTLAKSLSEHLQMPMVEEQSRFYLSKLNGEYQFEDLSEIARQQLKLEIQTEKSGHPCMICDTGLLVLKIWSEYKYGRLSPYIQNQWNKYACDLYILPHFDIPYEEDPLRENPHDRNILHQLYKDSLEQSKLPYIVVDGCAEERMTQSLKAIKSLLLSNS